MSDHRFEIVVNGVVRPGFDPGQARDNVAALFKTTRERVAGLFSGQEVVIKSAVDEATAERYRNALHQAGMFCRVRPLEVPPSAEPTAAATAADPPGPGLASGLSLSPEGTDLAEPTAAPPAAPDTSHLSAAAPGADLSDPDDAPPPPPPDTSHLSAAAPGADLSDPDDAPPPPPPDTSHLGLVPDNDERH